MTSVPQGWNPDPFGRFEDRYFSDGNPTALVRTGRVETRDEPGDYPVDTGSGAIRSPRAAKPVALRPLLYERRPRPLLESVVLGAASLVPLVGWELLAGDANGRIIGIGAFAGIAAALTALVRMFHAPQFRRVHRRPPTRPTPAP